LHMDITYLFIVPSFFSEIVYLLFIEVFHLLKRL